MKNFNVFEPFSIEKRDMFHVKGGDRWNTRYEEFNLAGELLESGKNVANDYNPFNNTVDDRGHATTDSKPPGGTSIE